MYYFFRPVWREVLNLKDDLDCAIHKKNQEWLSLNWAEPKRTETLSKINRIDKETFDALFQKYDKVLRMPNIKSTPTDDLRDNINKIDKTDLSKESKEKLIAWNIRKYMQHCHQRGFCVFLIKNRDNLISASRLLTEQAKIHDNNLTLKLH